MIRSIRVRQENQETAIELLRSAGFTAEPCETPTSQLYEARSYPDEDYAWDQQRRAEDTAGMVGIETNASGKQAHKVFIAGGMVTGRPSRSPRPCTCGSGESWVTCSVGSQYCG